MSFDLLIIPFLFLVAATVINWTAYSRGIALLQLVVFVCLFVGVVASLNAFGTDWYIPLMFILVNFVLFILGAVRKGLA